MSEPLYKHSPVIVDDYVDDYGGPSIQCEVESCGIRSRDWYLHFAPLLDHVDCPSCGGQGWVAEMTADPTPSGEPGEPYQVQVACEDSWHQMVVAAVDAAGGVFWDETAHVVARATPTPDTPAPSDLIHEAWAVIANAGGGDWSKETTEWRSAAANFSDKMHAATRVAPPPDTRLREALLGIIREAEEVTEAQHGTPIDALYAIIRRAREALTDD